MTCFFLILIFFSKKQFLRKTDEIQLLRSIYSGDFFFLEEERGVGFVVVVDMNVERGRQNMDWSQGCFSMKPMVQRNANWVWKAYQKCEVSPVRDKQLFTKRKREENKTVNKSTIKQRDE